MTHTEAIFLGLVQGIAEFLPISSSGHLVIVQQLLNSTEASLVFDVWLHVATLFAVVIFFRKRLMSFSVKQWLVVALASLPAAVVGLALSEIIEGWFGSVTIVAAALILTGIFNFWSNYLLKNQTNQALDEVNPKKGAVIGLMQALAIVPGISRSGSTVWAGLRQGLGRETAFSFSFILSIPAILGAALLQIFKLKTSSLIFSAEFISGGLAAFGAGLLSLLLLKNIITHSKLNYFGWYCFILSGALLIFA